MSQAPLKHIRTPLGRVRGYGSARSGTGHFWRQRLTAVANIPLTIAAVFIIVTLLGRNQAAAAQVLGSPAVAIIMLLVHRLDHHPHADRHAGDHRGLCA